MTDAAHLLSDVASFGVSIFAILCKIPDTGVKFNDTIDLALWQRPGWVPAVVLKFYIFQSQEPQHG